MRSILAALLVSMCLSGCIRAATPPEAAPQKEAGAKSKHAKVVAEGEHATVSAADAPKIASTGNPSAGSTTGKDPADATVQLNPYKLILPAAPHGAVEQVSIFYAAATRAVRQVYEDDSDDPSVLLALQSQLHERDELVEARPVWTDVLTSALTRAGTLRDLGPTLRALNLAMANAYLDPATHTYRGVELHACRTAFSNAKVRDVNLDSFVVTVEPLGTLPLSQFKQLCSSSRSVSLKERRMPGHRAPSRVAKIVRKLYNEAQLGGQVKRVAVVRNWGHADDDHPASLEAVVGVERGDHDGCSMQRLEIARPRKGAPSIMDVGDSEEILCNALR